MAKLGSVSFLVAGFALGVLSWAVCPLVSDQFEPFDTDKGFFIGQMIMVSFAAFIGFTKDIKAVFFSVFGMYVGQNAYSYYFGSSEARAWALLLLVSSLFLCIYPLVSGLVARGVSVFLQRRNTSI